MSNFGGFGDILRGVASNVVSSALNAAANRANVESYTVQEINGRTVLDEVSRYPVLLRKDDLVFHGPIESAAFFNKPMAYNIILHVPNSEKMFSLFRTDNRADAEKMFILYKETIPVLVKCDPSICELDKLERIVKKLRENQGWTAPHVAAAITLSSCLRHPLLKDKLNDQEGELLRTPLLVAIAHDALGAITHLLDVGVQVDLKDVKDNTIFHLAALQSSQTMKLLLDRIPLSQKELLNHLNAEGCTPLHLACKNNNSALVKALLMSGADVNIPSTTEGYPIHCAVKAHSVCSMQELIRQNPGQLQFKDLKDGGSPLHWAAGAETLIPLLELGCDPNMSNDLGNTPLHTSARRGCLKSTLNLLCHGAFTDMKGENGDTPLHVAARLCSRSVMQALIVFDADVNMTNANGDTPRHLVCTSQRSDKDKVLHTLHAVGAKRCSEVKQSHCVDGCKFSGKFGGIPPDNFPDHLNSNIMHDAMFAFSIQKQVQGRSAESMDIDGTSNHGGGTDLNAHVGGRLLTLDGGGIRGIVLTQMLLVIEQEFGVPVIDMFDWIAGTSTGGILALALACKKSVLETQGIYLRLKDKVFVGERPYSATVMEEFLKQEFGCEKTLNSIQRPRIMVMTALVDRRPADLHIFRNYLSPASMIGLPEACPQDPDKQFVWETAKVTGAAPSYFRLDHNMFVDGGLISNNPTLDALTEMSQFGTVMRSLGNFKEDGFQVPSTVVSLGTGLQPKTDSNVSLLDITWPSGILDAINKVPRLASLVNLLIDQATQTEGQVVERSRAWCSSIGVPFFRYSPQMSSFIDLDEKDDEKLINLLWETRCYMLINKDKIVEMKNVLRSKVPSQS